MDLTSLPSPQLGSIVTGAVGDQHIAAATLDKVFGFGRYRMFPTAVLAQEPDEYHS